MTLPPVKAPKILLMLLLFGFQALTLLYLVFRGQEQHGIVVFAQSAMPKL